MDNARRFLFLATLFTAAAGSVGATTYYVDSVAGNDANTGTSAPWKTLTKVSSHVFAPGDQILLKRGGIWYDQLTINSSGTAAAPITVSSYGTGASPIIDGRNVTWPHIRIYNRSYIAIKGLDLRNSPRVTIYLTGAGYVTIANCAFSNAYQAAIQVTGTSPGLVVDRNTYSVASTFAMYGSFLNINSVVDSLTVTNNSITFNDLSKASGVYALDVNNAIISGNTIRKGGQGIGIKAYTRNVSGNKIFDNSIYETDGRNGDGESIEFTGRSGTTLRASGLVYRNFIKGGYYTNNGVAAFQGLNITAQANIVIGPMQSAFHWSSTSTGGVFYNNTVYNTDYGFLFANSSSGVMYNNVVVDTSSRGIVAETPSLVTEDYNMFYHTGVNGVPLGLHSKIGDPQFVVSTPQAPNDVKLRSTSPAIGTGRTISTPWNMVLDPADTAFPYTTVDQNLLGTWERGAFAYR